MTQCSRPSAITAWDAVGDTVNSQSVDLLALHAEHSPISSQAQGVRGQALVSVKSGGSNVVPGDCSGIQIEPELSIDFTGVETGAVAVYSTAPEFLGTASTSVDTVDGERVGFTIELDYDALDLDALGGTGPENVSIWAWIGDGNAARADATQVTDCLDDSYGITPRSVAAGQDPWGDVSADGVDRTTVVSDLESVKATRQGTSMLIELALGFFHVDGEFQARLGLDTDQNPTTGAQPAGSCPRYRGFEYELLMTPNECANLIANSGTGTCSVQDQTGQNVGEFSYVFVDRVTVELTVPLSIIGHDNGLMDAQITTSDFAGHRRDCAPDEESIPSNISGLCQESSFESGDLSGW